VLCSNSLSSALARLKAAIDVCASKLMSFRAIGWVVSHEQILLPFSTPQPHALPSADSKATQAANNKERRGVRHGIVWCRTFLD
jgi:hypothetical protein